MLPKIQSSVIMDNHERIVRSMLYRITMRLHTAGDFIYKKLNFTVQAVSGRGNNSADCRLPAAVFGIR